MKIPNWLNGLNYATSHVIMRMGLQNKDEVMHEFTRGKLRPDIFPGAYNYGIKSRARLAEWLGLPAQKKHFKGPANCPHCGKFIY